MVIALVFVSTAVCTSVQKSTHKLGRTGLKQQNVIWLFKIETKCIQLDGSYAQPRTAHTFCNRERTQCRSQSNGNIAHYSVGQPQECQLLPLLGLGTTALLIIRCWAKVILLELLSLQLGNLLQRASPPCPSVSKLKLYMDRSVCTLVERGTSVTNVGLVLFQ